MPETPLTTAEAARLRRRESRAATRRRVGAGTRAPQRWGATRSSPASLPGRRPVMATDLPGPGHSARRARDGESGPGLLGKETERGRDRLTLTPGWGRLVAGSRGSSAVVASLGTQDVDMASPAVAHIGPRTKQDLLALPDDGQRHELAGSGCW